MICTLLHLLVALCEHLILVTARCCLFGQLQVIQKIYKMRGKLTAKLHFINKLNSFYIKG